MPEAMIGLVGAHISHGETEIVSQITLVGVVLVFDNLEEIILEVVILVHRRTPFGICAVPRD